MGARGLAIRDDLDAAALRRFAQGEADRGAILRALVMAQALEEASRAAAARRVGRERQSLRDARLRCNAEGLAGLRVCPRPALVAMKQRQMQLKVGAASRHGGNAPGPSRLYSVKALLAQECA